MYRERGTVGSKSEVVDRKRLNEVRDNRASHSMSQPVNGKGKAASNSVMIGKQLHDQNNNSRDSRSGSLSKTTISDGEIRLLCLYWLLWIARDSIRVRYLGFAPVSQFGFLTYGFALFLNLGFFEIYWIEWKLETLNLKRHFCFSWFLEQDFVFVYWWNVVWLF